MKEKDKLAKESSTIPEKNSFDKNLNIESIDTDYKNTTPVNDKKVAEVKDNTTWNEKQFDKEKVNLDLDLPDDIPNSEPVNRVKEK